MIGFGVEFYLAFEINSFSMISPDERKALYSLLTRILSLTPDRCLIITAHYLPLVTNVRQCKKEERKNPTKPAEKT